MTINRLGNRRESVRLRILSWNVEKLKAGREAIATKITSHGADLVALQEFQPGERGNELINLLAEAGYSVTIAGTGMGIRNVLFAKVPISPAAPPTSLPGEQWSGFWLEAIAGPLTLSFLHIPVLGYRRERQLYCDAVLKHCNDSCSTFLAVIGDLNTAPPGADEPGNRLPGGKWLRDLSELGWVEAWRHLNPTAEEYSWYSRLGNGFRIDQAWLSLSLTQHLVGSAFDHSAREEDLSDHSILLLDLEGIPRC
jgi:exodeoxyribonuclease-3